MRRFEGAVAGIIGVGERRVGRPYDHRLRIADVAKLAEALAVLADGDALDQRRGGPGTERGSAPQIRDDLLLLHGSVLSVFSWVAAPILRAA